MLRVGRVLWMGLALAGMACAEQTLDQSLAADPQGTVDVKNVKGRVHVVTWDKPEVHLSGTLGNGVERLEFMTQGANTIVHVITPSQGRRFSESNLYLSIPRTSGLVVECVSGGIQVTGVMGDQRLVTVSGSVRAEDGAGKLKAGSVSGGIDITGEYSMLSASTVSGSVEFVGSAEAMSAESVSGSVKVDGACNHLNANSTSGSVRVRGVSGTVYAESVSGSVTIDGTDFADVEAQSVSGSVELRGNLLADAGVDLESHSGRVAIIVPEGTSARVDLETHSGSIANELSGERAVRPDRGPGTYLRTTIGSGSCDIRGRSHSGSVQLLRL